MNRDSFLTASLAAPLALSGFGRALAAPLPQTRASQAEWLPALEGTTWLGGRPTRSDLLSRVVLVDVFTFECTNCANVLPNLQRLHARYSPREFAIVGVHTPEVPSYQGKVGYVARNVWAHGLRWPVVLDNDHHVWNAYEIDAWPTQLLFDRHGKLRARIVGDSQDDRLDADIVRLLAER